MNSPKGVPVAEPSTFTNLSVAELVEQSVLHGETKLARSGALVAYTGKHTGRSPKDRFIVAHGKSKERIDWGGFNQPPASLRERPRIRSGCEDGQRRPPGRLTGVAVEMGEVLEEILRAPRVHERMEPRHDEDAARAGPKMQLVVALLLVPSVLLLVAAALAAALLGSGGEVVPV